MNYRAGGTEGRPTRKDDWRTPPELYERIDREFHFTLDAACETHNQLAPVLAWLWRKYRAAKDDLDDEEIVALGLILLTLAGGVLPACVILPEVLATFASPEAAAIKAILEAL